ncbi:MAG: tellurite resistance TerB C-terminal domain-containing protein, partial [bacterium]|nr:tellurite resistance TerB C-terminal domain-containing protein [bacterium]
AIAAIFKLLSLDPSTGYSAVHAATTSRPASEPVTVKAKTAGPPRYQIPAEPTAGPQPIKLDHAAIAAKLAETAEVSVLLANIFAEDRPAVLVPAENAIAADLVAGLDAPHSRLLRALGGQPTWTRADFEALCSSEGLLPDGAVDTLNELAYEVVGDPLIDEIDLVVVDQRVAQEMLT